MGSLERQVADLQRQVRVLQSQVTGLGGGSPTSVASFNDRRGHVTLTFDDVTEVLGSYVVTFQGRDGEVTLQGADVTGLGLTAADLGIDAAAVGAIATTARGAANGVPGLDASSRLMIPAGTSAPVTQGGGTALGQSAVVGWIPVSISGVVSKIPLFQ